jgi:hypothetical protein
MQKKKTRTVLQANKRRQWGYESSSCWRVKGLVTSALLWQRSDSMTLHMSEV